MTAKNKLKHLVTHQRTPSTSTGQEPQQQRWERRKDHRKKILNAAIAEQGGKCFYCDKVFDVNRRVTADHLVPRSKGGWYTPDNIVAACLPCNQLKADMSAQEFLDILSRPDWVVAVDKKVDLACRRIRDMAADACRRILIYAGVKNRWS